MRKFTPPYPENLQRAAVVKELDLYPYFRAIEESDGRTVTVDQQRQVMSGSNNYLGLTHHPYVIEKAQEALARYGTGCTGSRFLNGNFRIHEELEERLADYVGRDAPLVYSTGMQANLGAISALVGAGDCILSDGENHASIIDGARLSHADVYRYAHGDMEQLSTLLQEHGDRYRNVLIVTDGVFSMSGDVAPLDQIVELADQYGALIYLADAHGIGVLGPKGRGTPWHFGLQDHVDFVMGTFSKSFASIGGFVAGDADAIDYVKHCSRSFIYSAAMPPVAVATVHACLDVIDRDDTLFDRLQENVNFVRNGLREREILTRESITPIVPILINDDLKAFQAKRFLEENGIFATPVVAPAVPPGEALIRTSYMASHEREDLQYCLDVFAKMATELALPAADAAA